MHRVYRLHPALNGSDDTVRVSSPDLGLGVGTGFGEKAADARIGLSRLDHGQEYDRRSACPEMARHFTREGERFRSLALVEPARRHKRHDPRRELAEPHRDEATTARQCCHDQREAGRAVEHRDERVQIDAIESSEHHAEAALRQ